MGGCWVWPGLESSGLQPYIYTRFPVVGLMFLWVYGLGFGVYGLLRFGVRGLRVQGSGIGV